MPTPRQEKLAEAIIENAQSDKPKTTGELLRSVGYGEGTAEGGTARIMEREGVQEALAARGFTPERAKETVAQIMTNPDAKDRDRLTAADMTLKVHGEYAPTKTVNLDLSLRLGDDPKLSELAKEFEERLRKLESE